MKAEELTFFGDCLFIFVVMAGVIYLLAKGFPIKPNRKDIIPLGLIVLSPAFMTWVCMAVDRTIAPPPIMSTLNQFVEVVCVALFAGQGASIVLLTPVTVPQGLGGWTRMVLLLLVAVGVLAISFCLLVTSTWLMHVGTIHT